MVSELDLAIAAIPRIRSKKAWSRVTWLHFWQIITSYPDVPSQQEKDAMNAWIWAEAALLPCPTCNQHFVQALQSPRFAKALESRTQLFLFFANLLNDINARTGNLVMTPLEQVRTVSRLINWAETWDMPSFATPELSAANAKVPWYSLLILGILALGAGLLAGSFIPQPKSKGLLK
jgi:hypothetical protein